MDLAGHSVKLIRFGVFEINLQAAELRKQGRRIKLQEQPFQILALLLDQRGGVVGRDDLKRRLWPEDTFVDFDHSLNAAVMRLREALGDSSENPRFIETIPKRGYRFIAPFEEVAIPATENHKRDQAEIHGVETPPAVSKALNESTGAEMEASQRRRTNTRRIVKLPGIVAASAALVLGLTGYYIHVVSASKAKSQQITSLVVLPLQNVSGDKDQDFFADGMTDELIAHLAKISSLRVISRTTAMVYRDSRKPLSEIARELKVDGVVEGTILRSGNRVRITAELIQVSSDRHLWAESYESQIGDILTLQGQVTTAIVNEISVKLTPEDQRRLTGSTRAVRPEAYENYLKGLYYWNKRSDEGLTKAISYYEIAIQKDPQYALAYAGLADCYGIIGATIFGTMPASDAGPRAKAAALKALELDETLAEAQSSLAIVQFNYDWDWAAAATRFKRALELNRSYATGYQRYSLYLIAMGRVAESVDQINRARELDPLSISINFSLGWRYYMAHQYNRAIEQLHNTIEMDPNYALAHLVLGESFQQNGEYQQAIEEMRKATAISPNSPLMLAGLGHALALAKKTSEAQAVLNHLVEQSKKQYVAPFYIALVYAGLGEDEKAMDWLERAYQDRSNGLVFLKVDPELDVLRSNPRFKELQRKMHFPE